MTATTPRPRAAIYARISDDRDNTGLGVARQEEDCRARVDIEGWDLVGVYIDNDISAYSGRPRPRWEALVSDVRDRKVDRIVCWAADRLTRHPRELEDLVELLEETGARIVALKDGEYDLATSGGRLVARILGSVARQESERKSERSRRKHEEMAFAGRPGGGGDRPFGYEADFMTVRADEADLIRDAAQQLLAGGTIRSILKNWNARGVEGTTGGPMAPQTFRRMMMSARIAGLRSHRGRIVADAAWPAIIDRDTHEKLQRLLTDPTRNRVENPARYLLTGGVATCGRCQLPMSARPADGGRKAYQCIVRTPGGPNCGGMKIDAFGLEAYVGGQILERLGPNTDILSALVDEALEATDRSVILAEIEDLKGRLAELEADYYQQRLVSRTVYLESRSVLDARLDDLRVQLAAQPLILPIAVPDLDLEAWWSEASIEERRGVVAILIDKVRVEPAVRGRNFFDPGRVDIAWRI